MITSTSFWKPSLAKRPCMTVHIVYQSVSEETFGAAATALENCPSASGDSTSRRKRRKKLLKVLVWTSSLIRSQNYQALNWCSWDVQIDNRFQRGTNWQKSTIYCGWFSSAFSQSLLRCGLIGMHNIELTRKWQKRYGIFRLSINHQHQQQLLKKQWKGCNNGLWNVENVKPLWYTI